MHGRRMEYKIVAATNTDKLSALVNKLTAEGWEPFGNLCYAWCEWRPKIYQPMIKRKM